MSELVSNLKQVSYLLKTASADLKSDETLTKIAFAKRLLDLNEGGMEKTASISEAMRGMEHAPAALTTALVAGVGLGLAGEVVGGVHKKSKELLFKTQKNSLINHIKKENPELKNMDKHKMEEMLDAGYKIAPDLMENPTLAASFVNIGNSLGGKIDPNTIKLYADANNKGGVKSDIPSFISSGVNFV